MKPYTIYNEDCIKCLKQMLANSMDLIITDCPYHIIGVGKSNSPKHINLGGILNRFDEENGQYAEKRDFI